MDYSGTAIYAGFAAVAALNTLLTVTVGRHRDFAVTQLAGATRQRLIGVVICEAVIVVVTALALAAFVAAVTLVPLLASELDTWLPYMPAPYLAAGVLSTAAVVAARHGRARRGADPAPGDRGSGGAGMTAVLAVLRAPVAARRCGGLGVPGALPTVGSRTLSAASAGGVR